MKLKLLLILITVGLIGCMIPQKSLENKNYDQTFKLALSKLRKNKATEENKKILSIALNEIINQKTIEINKYKKSKSLEKALRVVQQLQVKINAANFYLLEEIADQKNRIGTEEEHLKSKISNNFMLDGFENLTIAEKNNDKAKAKKAYYNFKKAQKYNNNIENIDSLMHISHQLGQKIYIVRANAPFDISYNWEIDRQFYNLKSLGGKFLKIHFEPTNKVTGVDCIIQIDFKNLCISESETKKERVFTKEIVTGTETVTNTDCETEEVEVTEEVSGKFITKTIVKTADWGARININARTKNCSLSNYSFSEDLKDEIEEYMLEGDKRAIPGSYKSKKSNDELMGDDEMADELIDDLYGRIRSYIL